MCATISLKEVKVNTISTMISIEHACSTLEVHINRGLDHGVPLSGAARQVLYRPFPALGDTSLLPVDTAMYASPVLGPKMRRDAIAKVIRTRRDVSINVSASQYTLIGTEQEKEDNGGVDSIVALAVEIGGTRAWCSIPNYHLYERRSGQEQVARFAGEKVLGPALIIAPRPACNISAMNTSAKHFPDALGNGFEWEVIGDGNLEIVDILTGIDLDAFV